MERESHFDTPPVFSVDDISVGAYAHGFGDTGDGRTYAFRVRGNRMFLDVYRADLATTVPDVRDVEATADLSVVELDLADERSIVGAVRDAVASATPVDGPPNDGSSIRAILSRLGSVIDPS
ncbi:hypothetical protein GCM10007304_25060 [Rhodococcoides trifolii]|uniref:Uncharacterized protein n=1 Tax=Rhodococcoides trifolii TaxID=908250 RepID=A0A917D4I4_9NOCA|nr:hypothetical protein GCM10007304_25060 [Rhodococcus trifolii]